MSIYNNPEGYAIKKAEEQRYLGELSKAQSLSEQRQSQLNYAKTLKNNTNLQSKVSEIESLRKKLANAQKNLKTTKNLHLSAYHLNKNKTIKNKIREKAGKNFIKKTLKNRINNWTNMGMSTSWRRASRYQNSLKPQIQRMEAEVKNIRKKLNTLLNSLPKPNNRV